MSKKKNSSFTKAIPNVPKKYVKVAHCDSCGEEQQVRRAVVVSGKTRKAWMCLKCSSILPYSAEATTKQI